MHTIGRREFLEIALAAGGMLSPIRAQEQSGESSSGVKNVLVMFKCHFDLGFIDTQAGIMRKYFNEFFPQAISIAQQMRDMSKDRYVWTTGSWLLYEYLEQADAVDRKRMEKAVRDGDIAWHALPFNWQTELLDRSLIAGAIGLSKSLDVRFGRTTKGAKMTDVPGHSRGLVGPLAENGVTFLDIGVNSASTPPEVPSLFVWKDPDGNQIIMMYHLREYGGVVRVPGSSFAAAIEVRNDNSGPHTIAEIEAIYAGLRRQFPNANIRAANLTDIANAVVSFQDNLPIITEEIGDTWIYGVPSDPVKVARYREIVRLRRSWIANKQLTEADSTDIALLRRFSLAAEHTWGTDTKTWLDFDHYTPHDLAGMLDRPNYKTVETSWTEKRDDINQGVATLPAPLRDEAVRKLAALKPSPPALSGLQPSLPDSPIESAHFIAGLDADTGALRKLLVKSSNRDWASPENPLALFAYQTLSKQDYDRFLASYVTSKADWAPKDFGKPNIEHFGAQSRTWMPKLLQCWTGEDAEGSRIVAKLVIDDAASAHDGLIAWPQEMYLEIRLPNREPLVHIDFSWFQKKANRLPEALWLTFRPNAPQQRNWVIEKVDRPVSPFDVVRGGNRHMHALSNGLTYKDDQGSFSIETLDAPVIALGERSPIAFSKDQPDLTQGIHFSLFNNAWGTNYIQWFGEDMRFRFTLKA
ncbi:MAG TPA: DUF5054 domain-containing protein [Bryobacteraceae bacterium]|jgi:hypothetical protein|nr:DUF5054 domain-containing protein [Bryobacteraceae bacterium]